MTNSSRQSVDSRGASTMVALCAVLGLHQVAIKLAAPDVPPILQISLRSGLSVILILLLLWRQPCQTHIPGLFRPGLLVGTLFSLEFIFVAEGLRFTTASHMSVFLYTAPIFTALTLHFRLPSERLRRHQWLGIALAFAGIVAAFSGGLLGSSFDPRLLRGDLLAVLAGAAWASTTILIRCTRLADAPATSTLLYQLVAAFLVLLGYAVCTGQASHFELTPLAWGSILFQGVVITFLTYLIWFSMLRRYHASQLSIFLFLTPLFGVSFGVLLLHDTIDAGFAIGTTLVLAGLTLVSRTRLDPPRKGHLPEPSPVAAPPVPKGANPVSPPENSGPEQARE